MSNAGRTVPDSGLNDRESQQPPDSLVGRVIASKYNIHRVIGVGGMGEVYQATQETLNREVAVKVLRMPADAGVDGELFDKMFLQEAAAAASLTSPHTITIYDFGQTEDEIRYIVMEFLEGHTIREAVEASGPFKPARAVHVGIQVCRSLREAHEKDIVHRDLKPANVMLAERNNDPDFGKVLDFGLVKNQRDLGEDSELSLVGRFVGSPKFAAPEQLQRRSDVDQRADIYAFGLLMYYMLASESPFNGDTRQIITAQLLDPPPPMEEFNPGSNIPISLEALVYRCLEKDPNRRFQSMTEVIRALSEVDFPDGADEPDITAHDLAEFAKELDLDDEEIVTEEEETTEGSIPVITPSAQPHVTSSEQVASSSAPQASSSASQPASSGPYGDEDPDKKKSSLPMILGIVAVVIGLGILAAVVLGGLFGKTPAGDGVDVEPPTPGTTDAGTQDTGTQDTEDSTPADADASATTAGTVAVNLSVTSSPAGATVSLVVDGKEQQLGSTPLNTELDLAAEAAKNEIVLVVRKNGYKDRTIRETAEGGALSSTVTLKRIQVKAEVTPTPAEPTTPEQEEPATPKPEDPEVDGYKDDPY